MLLPLLALGISGCQSGSVEKTELWVLNAGSLVIPFDRIEAEYERLHPEIDLKCEGHGSIQVVRHITEIFDEADIAAVADYSLLPLLMYPATMENGDPYADWHIRFATNRLGVAFTPESKYASEINADNWYEILLREDVNLGFSDPRIDAVGYRALMLLQLAEFHYNENNLFESLITRNFNSPVTSSMIGDGEYDIVVPELLVSTSDRIYLRGFSVQLLALLEAHQIDYAFEYESVAKQHGLGFVALPEEIDLSSEAMAEHYAQVTVRLDYHRYETVNPVFQGLPIIYGITIPYSAPHPEEAAAFLEFLLGEGGQKMLRDNYQPPIVPPEADDVSRLPDALKSLVE